MFAPNLSALYLWSGINVLVMLALAFNVTRHRSLSQQDPNYDKERLELAVRAHGNNVEYVPIILFMTYLLVTLGASALVVHLIGAILLVSRFFHAYGMQQMGDVHKARIVGVLGTWGLMAGISGFLLYQGLAG